MSTDSGQRQRAACAEFAAIPIIGGRWAELRPGSTQKMEEAGVQRNAKLSRESLRKLRLVAKLLESAIDASDVRVGKRRIAERSVHGGAMVVVGPCEQLCKELQTTPNGCPLLC